VEAPVAEFVGDIDESADAAVNPAAANATVAAPIVSSLKILNMLILAEAGISEPRPS
jgi:hypothetical protein